MAGVLVIRPGLQTTVQDLGRWGHQASGVPVAGAMDPDAHRRANALVGNGPAAATLEVTLVGPELRFEDDRAVAVSGAAFELRIDAQPVGCDGTLRVRSGCTLRFGARISGARAYVAVSGGIDVPKVLDSRSTHLPSGMGGVEGRALRAGDVVPLAREPLFGGLPRSGTISVAWNRTAPRDVVRVLAGPDISEFDEDALKLFVSQTYLVGNDSNRMGYRLQGAGVRLRGRADKLSDVTPAGTIQVLPSGQPVLLMADCQTTGGYPAIASVISADRSIVAQLAPGDSVRFAPASVDDAFEALFAQESELRRLEARE